jgi:hypothetical protein
MRAGPRLLEEGRLVSRAFIVELREEQWYIDLGLCVYEWRRARVSCYLSAAKTERRILYCKSRSWWQIALLVAYDTPRV